MKITCQPHLSASPVTCHLSHTVAGILILGGVLFLIFAFTTAFGIF